MAYTTYRRDMRRVGKDLEKWGKLVVKVHDPFELFIPTVLFFTIPCAKAIFFTTRKIINK